MVYNISPSSPSTAYYIRRCTFTVSGCPFTYFRAITLRVKISFPVVIVSLVFFSNIMRMCFGKKKKKEVCESVEIGMSSVFSTPKKSATGKVVVLVYTYTPVKTSVQLLNYVL